MHATHAIIFLALFAYTCLASIVLLSRRVRRFGAPELWFERLRWRSLNWTEGAQAWADAIANAGEWLYKARHWRELQHELDDMATRLSGILCEATEGRMSKHNYDVDSMVSIYQEAREEAIHNEVVDLVAHLPNWQFSWARIRDLCENFGISPNEVSERRAQIKDIEKLVRATKSQRVAKPKRGKPDKLKVCERCGVMPTAVHLTTCGYYHSSNTCPHRKPEVTQGERLQFIAGNNPMGGGELPPPDARLSLPDNHTFRHNVDGD